MAKRKTRARVKKSGEHTYMLLRMTPAEKAAIKAASKKQGVSMAELIRSAAAKASGAPRAVRRVRSAAAAAAN